ncbi:MAG TPA: hemin uptake protein HemP [Myxococcota bacterium]|nr:hemin uptake protein HemP [Myxococcota bacterium]
MRPDARDAQPKPVRQISSQELLGPERLLHIEHNGEIYTLRLTRNDRLILTK